MQKWVVIVLLASLSLVEAEASVDMTNQQRQDLFQKHKALEEKSHQERIKILQEADECVKHAATPQSYKECERREQAARLEFKKHHHPQKEALRHEREMIKEKSMHQIKNQQYPRGTIETH